MSPGRILIIDDDPNLIEVLKLRIESADYEVTSALTVEEALEAVRDSAELALWLIT